MGARTPTRHRPTPNRLTNIHTESRPTHAHQHPDVRQCAVVGVDNAEWGQIIVAVIVAADDATPDPEQLRDYAAAACAVRVHPTRWCFVTNCPPPRPAR